LDVVGRTAARIDALGHRTTYTRDAAGQQTAVMNARGAVTTTVYDAAGRTQAIDDAAGNRTTLGYDAVGRQVSATNALGDTSTTVYDTAGRTAAGVDPLGYRTSFSYDAAGRRIAQIDPLGHWTTTVYDAGSQRAATVNPLGYRTTLSYDATGRQIATIDAYGNISTRVYNEVGRPAAEVNALGHRTTSVYNAVGWRMAILDANGGRNTYTHDAVGRIVQHTDPLGRITTFSYDAAGRQTSILDARGVRATFQYDAANRLTTRTSTNDLPVTFGYDAVGNHTDAIDGIGRSTFSYDLLNRRLTAIDPVGNAITYTYDAIGKRATMTAPDGGIFTYAYGARGQIAHLVNPQGDRTTFSYDAAGRRTLTELGNATRASYTYDDASQVTQLYNLKADDSVILGLTYERDSAGKPIGMLESSGDRVTWTYDAGDRLTREQRSGASAYDTTYTYDPLGNRLVKQASGALTTYAYDLANQLTTSRDASGVTTYTYDLAGNLQVVEQSSGQRTTNTWDDQNRQTGVQLPVGGIVTSAYRFDGLRHEKAQSDGITKYIWDFQNYLAEIDAAETIEAVYTNEPQQYGKLISQYRKGPTIWVPSYYTYDALGSTRLLTNEGGSVKDLYVYDAWGNGGDVTGTTVNPFQWVGRVGYYWDEIQGAFYIRARVYDPVTGRWMSQDPLGFADGLNLYVPYFVPNGTDPSGTRTNPCKCALTSVTPNTVAVAIGGFDKNDPIFIQTNPGRWTAKEVHWVVCLRSTTYTVVFNCRECPPAAPFVVTRTVKQAEYGTVYSQKGILTKEVKIGLGKPVGLSIEFCVVFEADTTTGQQDIDSANQLCEGKGGAPVYTGTLLWTDGNGNTLSIAPTIPQKPFGISCDGAEKWPL